MLALDLAQDLSETYMPHGMCYLWEANLVWLHVVSDVLITAAYWAIPPFLVYLAVQARRRIPEGASYSATRLPYDWLLVAFGAFIVACGATHAMGIWTIWEPRYWLEGGVKAVTALASIATAIALPPLVPRVLDLIEDARVSERRREELEEAHREQQQLVERLREADEAKTRFFANVSHDLRTPLALVLGTVEDALEEDLPDEAREQLDTALRNARSLRGRVEDLLAVARSEAGSFGPEARDVDAAELVRELAERFRVHARQRSIAFEVQAPPSLPARLDLDMVERALQNLLSNAFQFTPDGGTVRCELDREDGALRLTVADSGPGLPEEDRDVVFAPFHQGPRALEAGKGGIGLGLAIVRDVAEAHGGSVAVESAPEGGALFVLQLPIGEVSSDAPAGDAAGAVEGVEDAPEPAAGAEAGTDTGRVDDALSPQEAAASDRPVVLVVEDNRDMRAHLARLLSDDYAVVAAADGREALEVVEEVEPDLIVTDVMMPRMDGAELIAAVRERPELSSVPVLVLTARAEEELPERLLRSGAQDYVLKPFDRGELLARAANLLDLTRSRRLLQEELSTGEESLEALARAAASRKRELERAVEEKKLLLRELHHRVKGNLQTIGSLLNLQLRSVEDESARRSLEESRGRVTAIALLHEKLYRTGVPDRVGLSGYVRRLLSDIVRAGPTDDSSSAIETVFELDEVEVAVDDAVALGLVVHELVTNVLRHAFPEGRPGRLRVALRSRDGEAVLEVEDDGVGIERREERDDSVGFDLVGSLVRQLEGRMEVNGTDGTRVRIVFPVPPAASAAVGEGPGAGGTS